MLNFNKLDRQELSAHGICFATSAEASLFAEIIMEELQVRVGEAISSSLSKEKNLEFDKCETQEQAAKWLDSNCPDYRWIVEQTQKILFYEIMSFKDKIPGLIESDPNNIKAISIDNLDLCIRSSNSLKRAGLFTVGDLLDYGDLSVLRNLSPKCLLEIKEKLLELTKSLSIPIGDH